MKIIINENAKTFWTNVPVSLLRDKRLSYQARGVLGHLLSMSKNWEFRAGSLCSVLKESSNSREKLGKQRIQNVLRELQKNGYLIRTKYRSADGKWVWESTFFPLAGASSGDAAADDFSIDESLADEKLVEESHVNGEETTTEADSVDSLDFSHPILRPHLIVIDSVCRQFMNGAGITSQQMVVDELTGVLMQIENGKRVPIKSIRAWLRAFFLALEKGEFVEEFATRIKKYRLEEKSKIEKKKLDEMRNNDPILKQKSIQISQKEMSTIKSIVAKKKGDLK
jgi:hypothetical protein